MNKHEFNTGLLAFIQESPTPFHAVRSMVAMLAAGGFQSLDERDAWSLQPGGSYLVERGGALVAFRLGSEALLTSWYPSGGCAYGQPLPESEAGG